MAVRKEYQGKVKIEKWKKGLRLKWEEKENKLVIIGVYNNTGIDNIKDDLANELENYEVAVVGDFNSRIGREGGNTEEEERMTQDELQNEEGRKLLDLFGPKGMKIMNGRSEGDKEGCYTNAGPRGCSVVDHVWVNEEGGLIKDMKIQERPKSNHMPIVLEMNKRAGIQKKEKSKQGGRMRWRDEIREVFKNKLEEKWTKIQWGEAPERINDQLAEVFEEAAAKESNMKKSGVKGKEGIFDREIYEKKKRVKERLKKFREGRKWEERIAYLKEKRELKQLVKRKKIKSKEEEWRRVDNCKNTAEF